MLPHIDFIFFGHAAHLHTYTWMIGLYAVFAIIAFAFAFRKNGQALKALALATSVCIAAFYGARLFHLLVEKPISEFEWNQLTYFDGMTFYGSLIAGVLVTGILTPLLFRKSDFARIADYGAILTAAGYGFLRLGCFANGCCWGRLTAVPWAVRYTESNVMPGIGLPVHPVQLYDSAVGFAIAAGLLYLLRSKKFAEKTQIDFSGLLLPIFMIAYSIGRMITEIYRGDGYRGENVFLFFSTSQTISLVVALIGAIALGLLFKRRQTHV